MLGHKGDSRHTQNIQINKVIGENVSFILWEKTYILAKPIHARSMEGHYMKRNHSDKKIKS